MTKTITEQYKKELLGEYLDSSEREYGMLFEDYVYSRVMKDRQDKGNPYAHVEFLEEQDGRA